MAYGRIRATAATLRNYLSSQVAQSKHIADLVNLPDMAIRWAIQQRFPDIATIFHKNNEDFGDNLVWYFGPPGDIAVEIGGSFLRAAQLLKDNATATVSYACDLLDTLIQQKELARAQSVAASQEHSPSAPDVKSSHGQSLSRRWLGLLTIIAGIDAVVLFTFTGLLILHGIILVPAIVSGVAVAAILGAVLWSRTSRYSQGQAAVEEG